MTCFRRLREPSKASVMRADTGDDRQLGRRKDQFASATHPAASMPWKSASATTVHSRSHSFLANHSRQSSSERPLSASSWTVEFATIQNFIVGVTRPITRRPPAASSSRSLFCLRASSSHVPPFDGSIGRLEFCLRQYGTADANLNSGSAAIAEEGEITHAQIPSWYLAEACEPSQNGLFDDRPQRQSA